MRVKVWKILEGPTSVDDLPNTEQYPEGARWFLVCKAEVDGVMGEDLFWFEDLEDAYGWQKYLLESFEPLVIDMAEGSGYN